MLVIMNSVLPARPVEGVGAAAIHRRERGHGEGTGVAAGAAPGKYHSGVSITLYRGISKL